MGRVPLLPRRKRDLLDQMSLTYQRLMSEMTMLMSKTRPLSGCKICKSSKYEILTNVYDKTFVRNVNEIWGREQ